MLRFLPLAKKKKKEGDIHRIFNCGQRNTYWTIRLDYGIALRINQHRAKA
jgi:hypothetical protein